MKEELLELFDGELELTGKEIEAFELMSLFTGEVELTGKELEAFKKDL